MRSRKHWLRFAMPFAALAYGALPARAQTASTAPTGGYERLTTIAIPGKPLLTYDISFVDPVLHLYYLSDRTNAGVDVIDTRTNRFLVRITGNTTVGEFSGQQASNNFSGPNGVAPADFGRVWAGDGDSTVKIMDPFTAQVVKSINTGGTARANEMSYDPRDHIMLVSNEADTPPFISLISTRPGHEHILAKITFTTATNGVQASIYNPANGLFYVNVPQIGTDPTNGEVAVVDPRTATVIKTFPISNCQAVGMALGPRRNLLLGCSTLTNSAASPALPTQVIDDFSGAVIAWLPQIGGTDEAWYDPGNKTYFIASRYATGGSMLGVIDARTNAFLGSVPTGKGSHSVAVDPYNNHVFVPLPANSADPACLNGCIGVYGRPT
jgi:DNA-binding beta-propeller fold protein YncE